MAHERMLDRSRQPSEEEMLQVIGQPLADAWTGLRRFLMETYDITPVYNDGGKTYGWNLQHRKGSRPLCEMYPEYGSFTALVILGKIELEQAMSRLDEFGPLVRTALEKTPRFHDGCWMYIRVSDPETCLKDVADIEQLILLKKKPPKKKLA
jgi:hypothetical protein